MNTIYKISYKNNRFKGKRSHWNLYKNIFFIIKQIVINKQKVDTEISLLMCYYVQPVSLWKTNDTVGSAMDFKISSCGTSIWDRMYNKTSNTGITGVKLA